MGQKWECFSCGAKFYDLNRDEPLCPKCGKSQKDSPVFEEVKPPRAKRARARPKAKKAPKPVATEKETGLKLSNDEEELAGKLDAKLDDDDLDDGLDDDLELEGDAPPGVEVDDGEDAADAAADEEDRS